MRYLLTFIGLLFLCSLGYAQGKMRAVWEIGSTASVVKTSYVGEGVNSSFGFFLGLQKAIFKNPKMNWVSRLGLHVFSSLSKPRDMQYLVVRV